MQKIKIKISPETLFLLQKIENKYANLPAMSRADRIQKSIRWELFQKLSRWCVAYTTNPNGKPRTIELNYHLAHRLYDDIFFTLEQRVFGFYEANLLEMLKNTLHQKLL